MGRLARGWQLTKHSWSVVRADRSLVVFPVISGIAGVVTAAVFFGAGAAFVSASDKDWVAIPFVVVGLYLLIAIGIFCGVALSACAARSLEGHDTTVGEGIAAARERMDVILAWAGVQLVVGALISIVQALLREAGGQIVSAIVGGLANLAWTVATFFVVPVIALEGLGPKDAVKRSSGIIRERWGEGVAGAASIGGIAFIVGFLPAGALIALGIAVADSSAGLAALLIVVGAVVLVVAALLQMTISAVFKVALFRFAIDNKVLAGYQQEELAEAFAPRRRRGA
jgi:hypothetical protein